MPPPSTNNSKGNNGESSSTTGGSRNTGQTQQADGANDEQTGKKNMNGSFFFRFVFLLHLLKKIINCSFIFRLVLLKLL